VGHIGGGRANRTLLIVRDLLRGPGKFQDLAASLGRVPPGILSRRLTLLERRGIVSRRIYSAHPPRAEYSLTPAGIERREAVRALTIWGAKHLPGTRALVHHRCGHPIEMAYRCAHCDEMLALDEINYRTEAPSPRRKTRQPRSKKKGRMGIAHPPRVTRRPRVT
jgi:DNA-binding HxlR family transcriptional regulator